MVARYTQLRWSTVFDEKADKQLTLMLRYCGIERNIETIMNVYSNQALGPMLIDIDSGMTGVLNR